MNASTKSSKNDQRDSHKPLNFPTTLAMPAGLAQKEAGDKAIASQLLSSKMPSGDSGDSDGLLNPITESSGSDHHSDSQNSSRPSSRPRASSDTHLQRPSFSSGSGSPAVPPDFMHAVSRAVTHSNPVLQSANGDENTCISLSLFKSSGPRVLRSDAPQPITTITTSSSAPNTPSTSDKQTYSFVFTSSRQPQILGGETLIGVVNPSINKELPLPKKRSSFAPKQRRKSTLTPEQIRAHALGAIHAISEDSPFRSAEHARPSAVAQMDLPLQTPVNPENVDPIDRSLQRHGIDFYVNAARQGRNKMPQATGSSSRPPPTRSFSHATTLESLGEDTGQTAFLDPAPPSPSDDRSRRPSRTRPVKAYSRYVEDESNEAAFTTTGGAVMRRAPSAGSSASSSRSKQSIDESLTGLSCFGVIGSGAPSRVFGSAVVSPNPVASVGRRATITEGTSSNASTPSVTTKPTQT